MITAGQAFCDRSITSAKRREVDAGFQVGAGHSRAVPGDTYAQRWSLLMQYRIQRLSTSSVALCIQQPGKKGSDAAERGQRLMEGDRCGRLPVHIRDTASGEAYGLQC